MMNVIISNPCTREGKAKVKPSLKLLPEIRLSEENVSLFQVPSLVPVGCIAFLRPFNTVHVIAGAIS